MQEKYRGSGKVVDKKIRDALVERIKKGIDLSEDQEKVFKEVDELFGRDEGWKDLESPYAGVEMWINYKQKARGERSIALGKAESAVDCTAEEACSWCFEYCSEERMAVDRKERNPARLEIREGGSKVNEKLVATVKSMPFPLNNLEFVAKLILRNNDDGSVSVAVVPTDSVIDYGGNIGRMAVPNRYLESYPYRYKHRECRRH